MLKKEDFICIGFLGRSHGIKGEITAKLDIEIDELYQKSKDFFLMLEESELLIPYRVQNLRPKHNTILIQFSGIENKESADLLTNRPVWLAKNLLSDVKNISFNSLAQLEGFTLFSASGQKVGRILEVDESTINTILYVESPKGDEHIIPFAEELISHLDIEREELAINIAEGLLDLKTIEEV